MVLSNKIDFKVYVAVHGANPNGDPLMVIVLAKLMMVLVKFLMLQLNGRFVIVFKIWDIRSLCNLPIELTMDLRV